MFEQLDHVYMPSRDVAVDVAYFTDVLGGRLVVAIDSMGTRVAMVELTACTRDRESCWPATPPDLGPLVRRAGCQRLRSTN